MCVNCYHIKITFSYKVIIDSRKKKKVKLVIDQTFDWLSSHLVYFIYIILRARLKYCI